MSDLFKNYGKSKFSLGEKEEQSEESIDDFFANYPVAHQQPVQTCDKVALEPKRTEENHPEIGDLFSESTTTGRAGGLK